MARAALCRLVEPGDPDAAETIGVLPAVEAWERVRAEDPSMDRWRARAEQTDPERDLDRAAAAGARFVIPGDDEWPDHIDVLAHAGAQNRRVGAPYGLWVRGPGRLRDLLDRSVAIVGSRACSPYGAHVAGELAAGVAQRGMTVVSGGAYGIDAAAHRGALAAGGNTVAILACGIDRTYPSGNFSLFERIAEEGLVVGELPPGSAPTKLRFLARNRLIAAGTLGTTVAEAAVRSGALNTARWADLCGRTVLAVPGPITSAMSQGTHLLVRESNAILVTSAADILEALSPPGQHLTPYPQGPTRLTDQFPEGVRRVLDAVPVKSPATTQKISTTAGLPMSTVEQALTQLTDAGLVQRTPTGWRLGKPPAHPSPT